MCSIIRRTTYIVRHIARITVVTAYSMVLDSIQYTAYIYIVWRIYTLCGVYTIVTVAVIS